MKERRPEVKAVLDSRDSGATGESVPLPSSLTPRPPRIPDHELLRLIGRGSYGEVWLARSKLGTLRAVKIIYRQTFDDERPFQREFKGIERFEPVSRSHEGLVDILQVGGAEDCFYYVMELADWVQESGVRNQESETPNVSRPETNSLHLSPDSYAPHTLRSELKRHGAIPIDRCLKIGLALSSALAHLHRHGLIHRDVKPSNIIFVNGVPQLADIGLVAEMSEARSYVGTEGFIPPEGPGTPQSDLYSLGKVLYEISTGRDRRDFPALPIPAPMVLLSHRMGEGSGVRAETDEAAFLELNAVVVKACKADARERYQSADEMQVDLALLQRGQSVKAKRMMKRRLAFAKKLSIAVVALALLVSGSTLLLKRFNVSTLQRFNAPIEANSIAVLPFVNENANWTPHEYLTDALTLETINALINCAGLRVAPRAAVFAFKRTTNDLRQVGTQLGVRTVLAGSMRKFTNQLHIAARLINVADGSDLWSASYDQDSTNFAAIQRDVVRHVTRHLNLPLDDGVLRCMETNLVQKLDNYKLYREASASSGNTQDGLDRSIRLLNQLIAQDPDSAPAYAMLAHRCAGAAGFYLPPEQAMLEAKKNAVRALQLDDSVSLAHHARALVYYRHELDLAQAKSHFQRSIELAPNSGDTYQDYAIALAFFGQFAEADRVLKCGEQIVSKDQHLLGGWFWRYYLDRNFEKARQAANRYTISTTNILGPWFLALAAEGLHRYDEALALAERARQWDPSPDMVSQIGRLHARLGHQEEAQKALDEIRVLSQSPGGGRTFSAEVLLALGETNRAIESLQRAVDDYPPIALLLKAHPIWDDLRSDPRFAELLRKAGLEK